MKIYEIITESTNEGALDAAARFGGKLIAPIASAGAKLLGKGPTDKVIATLAQRIAAGEKVTVATTSKLLKNAGSSEKAAEVLSKARSEAKALQSAKNLAGDVAAIKAATASAKDSVKAGASWLFKLGKLGLGAYYLSLFKEPLDLYLNNLEAAESRLNASDPKDRWTPKEFDAYRQREMSALIGKWAMLWGTGKLVKIPFGMFTKIVGAVSPRLAAGLGTLSLGAQAYFMGWVNKPENSQDIAAFMAQPLMNFAAGGVGVAAEDKIRAVIPFAKKYDSASAAQNSPESNRPDAADPQDNSLAGQLQRAQGAKPEADNKPDNLEVKPAAPETSTKKDPAEWKYHSPGFVQNKRTGEIDYAN